MKGLLTEGQANIMAHLLCRQAPQNLEFVIIITSSPCIRLSPPQVKFILMNEIYGGFIEVLSIFNAKDCLTHKLVRLIVLPCFPFAL